MENNNHYLRSQNILGRIFDKILMQTGCDALGKFGKSLLTENSGLNLRKDVL